MLRHFLEHRKEVIRRRTQFLLRRARQRAHILEGLILAVGDIDEIIEIIKKSPDVPDARERLMDAAAAADRGGHRPQAAAGDVRRDATQRADQHLTGCRPTRSWRCSSSG